MLHDLGPAIVTVGLILVYVIPSAVAESRKHHNAAAIGVMNLLLGWTGIGWVLALIWACTAVRKD